MRTIKIFSILIFIAFLFIIYENIMAFKDGIVGVTRKNGKEVGCVCHNFKPNDSVSVVISGPSNVQVNDTAIYTLKIAEGPAAAGGCDIAASLGNVFTTPVDTSLKRLESFPGAGFELTHRYPKLFINDTLTFIFRYVAPSTANIVDTLFANGNSTDNDTTSDNDMWNYAPNFRINITPVSGISGNASLIKSFDLYQNYPNPFNPETSIKFTLNTATNISMLVYDVNGRRVATLIDDKFYSKGDYSLTFNASQFNLTSGVYFYKLNSPDFASRPMKMILLK